MKLELPKGLFADCELVDLTPEGKEANLWIHFARIIEAHYVEGCRGMLVQFQTWREVEEYKKAQGIEL